MAMNLRRKPNRTEDFEAKTRITYVLETNKKVIDTTVIGYVDASPQESVESTRSYVFHGHAGSPQVGSGIPRSLVG
jgi:hypothetical protein